MKRPYLVGSGNGTPDLNRLARMRPHELQMLYREIFCRDANTSSSEYIRRKIAWHIQAEKGGILPESARQHALAIAKDARLRVRIVGNVSSRSRGLPLDHARTTHVVSDHDSRLPMPGSFLVIKHKGRSIVVKVLNNDFEYDGRRFSSLSAIAQEITGTKWNGFVFFGLTKEVPRGR